MSATQTLTVAANDDETGIAGYYIGKTDPSMALVSYTGSSSATIDSDGVWYIAVKDGAGNVTVTTRTIQKITLSAGNGATVSPNSLLVEYGSNIGLPAATKTGYHASAWSASDGSHSGVTIVYGCRSNLTMAPDWEANQYTVTFDGNGATAGYMARMNMVYDQPRNLSAFAYQKTGSLPNSSCWKANVEGAEKKYSDGQPVENLTSVDGGNVTLYANWDDIRYFIAFDGNGATSGSMAMMDGLDGKGIKYTASTALTTNQFARTGYTFKGWNTAQNGSGNSYSDGAAVSQLTTTNGATVTLYAQWAVTSYNISYDYNGATSTPSNSATYRTDSASFTLNNPSRTGYDFSGWTGSNGSTPQTSVTIATGTTGDLSFKANWTPKVYKVTLNSQSATSAGTAALYEKYATGWYTSSDCTSTASKITVPTRTGYTFGGYYTQTNGGGTQYIKADGTISAGNKTFTAATTLYAKWTVKKYTLTFNANGGSCSESSRKVDYNSAYGTLPTPTQNGCGFDGWYTAKTGGTKVTASTKMGDSNVTVYAQWIKFVPGLDSSTHPDWYKTGVVRNGNEIDGGGKDFWNQSDSYTLDAGQYIFVTKVYKGSLAGSSYFKANAANLQTLSSSKTVTVKAGSDSIVAYAIIKTNGISNIGNMSSQLKISTTNNTNYLEAEASMSKNKTYLTFIVTGSYCQSATLTINGQSVAKEEATFKMVTPSSDSKVYAKARYGGGESAKETHTILWSVAIPIE